MNKTLITLGIGIWAVIIALNFLLKGYLEYFGLNSEDIMSTLLPLTIIELIAFIITLFGLLKDN
jgi:F0F1-type ATP synthase membrane subunit a